LSGSRDIAPSKPSSPASTFSNTRSGWLHNFFKVVIADSADKLTLPLLSPVMNHPFNVHFHLSGQVLSNVQTEELVNKVINKTPGQTM
jgi:hypothetical protein